MNFGTCGDYSESLQTRGGTLIAMFLPAANVALVGMRAAPVSSCAKLKYTTEIQRGQ